MSKNNLIKKSDKKFIRREKARIRGLFLDVKKREEAIIELYKKFIPSVEKKSVSDGSKTIETPLNPKSEILNPKQIQKPKSKIQKTKTEKLKVAKK